MRGIGSVIIFSLILLIPGQALAQSPDRIILLDNFGAYKKGESLFIYGNIASVLPDSFLILQIVNPRGELCQIQQLTPLSNGLFLTESIPLVGRLCGVAGNYEVKIFYGQYFKEAQFSVSSSEYLEKTGAEYFDSAVLVVSEKIDTVQEKTGAGVGFYSERLAQVITQPTENSIEVLEQIYVDLWDDFFIEDELFDIEPNHRAAIEGALFATAELVEANKLSFDIAKKIDRETYAAIFYSQIGDTKKAVEKLNDAFVLILSTDPIKTPEKPQKTFAELEETLLNLMKKSKSLMNRPVKEEVAFIFSRGTAPLYSDEINQLIDLLSKSRYLDVILRSNNEYYRLVQNEWESTKSSLQSKDSISDLLEPKEKVDKLHQAALILRQLDKVDRFISSDKEENSELANLILPRWDDLQSDLELATTVDQILDSQGEVESMKKVIDASSRISKVVDISKESNVDSAIISDWEDLLVQVEQANSIEEILDIVSEFDQSIVELREKRNPLSILKFEYDAMKAKAELQADNQNLFIINNALKIIDTAQKMQKGNPPLTRIDRIEVLLTWASEKAPQIKEDLNSYSQDAHKIRASDILQRAKSIENLVDLSFTKSRFLPGFTDFTDSMMVQINDVRDLVIKKDLDAADNLVRELFSEWQEVKAAYDDEPYGSDVGYSLDELKRIEYRDRLGSLSYTVSNFYNADFAPYSDEFVHMTDKVSDLIDQGNFVDADSKLKEINQYLRENLPLNNQNIIFNTNYNPENGLWALQGYIDKPIMDRREKLYVNVYSMDGSSHSSLKFTDTRQGEFLTQWEAPAESGLYIIMLQYHDSKASQIVTVDEPAKSYKYDDLEIVDLSREFEQLKEFIDAFGGSNLQSYRDKFDLVKDDIKTAISDRDLEEADDKLSELKRLIERYLPARSRSAVIEANLENDKLYISGAVQKTLSFREDLFVDIYDQGGNHVEEIAIKDTSSGKFDEMVSIPLQPGVYVAQLQYHDLIVSDFFNVSR